METSLHHQPTLNSPGKNHYRTFRRTILALLTIFLSLHSTNAPAQLTQPAATPPNNVFDPGNVIQADVGQRDMPNIYYAYKDPSYSPTANGNQGFVNDVVQRVITAVKGVTQPSTSSLYVTSSQTYQYVWAFFGMLVFCGLLLGGFSTYQEVITGKATNEIWIWYALRIVVAVFMWTNLINAAPYMMISFINTITGMPTSSLSVQMQNATTKFTDSNSFLQAIANGKVSDTTVPYLTSVAVAYNTLDKTTVLKSDTAIDSVINFQDQLGYAPQQAKTWIEDMYGVSYQIHMDTAGNGSLDKQYGYDMQDVIDAKNGWLGLGGQDKTSLAIDIANALNTFADTQYTPPSQLSPEDQVIAAFLASQRAASLKFYTQVTNRLRAIAKQPMLPVPGIPVTDRTADNWLGPNSGKDQPPNMTLRYPDSGDPNQSNSAGINPNTTNPDNTLAAAGMLENAIPQPGEAPPVSRLVHQPELVKNVVNFALVEIGVSIWSLPLLLMASTAFLVLPSWITSKPYTHHATQAFLQCLTLLIACTLISIFIELATMNSATNFWAIDDANKKEQTQGARAASLTVGMLFGNYDPVTVVYTALILASLPIAVGIVSKGTNQLAAGAWGALNASGMSGVTAMNSISSGQTNNLAGAVTKEAAHIFTGGLSDIGALAQPRAPSSPGG